MATSSAAKQVADPAPSAPAQPEAKRAIQQLDGNRRKFAEFVRNEHVIIAHSSNTQQDILQPEYYAHVAQDMKIRDRVEIWADDMTWMAQLVVLEVGRGWVKVHPIALNEFAPTSGIKGRTFEEGGYRVVHRGEFAQWSVVRIADGTVVRETEATQGGAVDWLINHLKAQK